MGNIFDALRRWQERDKERNKGNEWTEQQMFNHRVVDAILEIESIIDHIEKRLPFGPTEPDSKE